jgi:hypothetical protein
MNNKKNIKIFLKKCLQNKLLFGAVVFTFVPFIIWSFGAVSYLWSIISKFILYKLPSWTTVFFLLIAPFVAFFLGLISYLKNKDDLSKKLFILNLIFISLSIVSSILFS